MLLIDGIKYNYMKSRFEHLSYLLPCISIPFVLGLMRQKSPWAHTPAKKIYYVLNVHVVRKIHNLTSKSLKVLAVLQYGKNKSCWFSKKTNCMRNGKRIVVYKCELHYQDLGLQPTNDHKIARNYTLFI